jgi:ABC-type transport system involved in multi-copper enzyme maturation permease subunit
LSRGSPSQLVAVLHYESRVLFKSVRWASVWVIFAISGVVGHANLLAYNGFTSPPNVVSQFAYWIVFTALPITAVVMSFDVSTGGIEDKTLSLLFSYPINRSRILAGKVFSRFVLSVIPLAALFAVLIGGMLVTGEPITSDLAWRLPIVLGILASGLLFWEALATVVSTLARTSAASLLYCVALLGIIWYNVHFDVIQNLILTIWLGHPVALSQFFLTPDYKLEVLFGSLVPPDIGNPMQQLLQTNANGSFAWSGITGWLSGFASPPTCGNCYGWPNFVPLGEIAAFVLAFLGVGILRFRRIRA